MNATQQTAVFALAQKHTAAITRLADEHQITWQTMETPKPDAMRAFTGTAPGYLLNIVQANVARAGIVHKGMAVCGSFVMVLPDTLADRLYHEAAAERN